MAINEPFPILICYDIASPRRLQRLHRQIARQAVMVQYSVYYTEENVAGVARLAELILGYIDQDEDDVRIYRLPSTLEIDLLGAQASPCLPVLEFRSKISAVDKTDNE